VPRTVKVHLVLPGTDALGNPFPPVTPFELTFESLPRVGELVRMPAGCVPDSTVIDISNMTNNEPLDTFGDPWLTGVVSTVLYDLNDPAGEAMPRINVTWPVDPQVDSA
jgi:hypothetical protein